MTLSVLFVLLISHAFATASGGQESKLNNVIINSLLHGLASETWSHEDRTCRRDTEHILHGVQNHTKSAIWVWDSMQLPAGSYYGALYHFGNYDQCLTSPVTSPSGARAQYCLVDVHLASHSRSTAQHSSAGDSSYDDADRYFDTEFRRKHAVNTIFVGVCLPESCGAQAVARVSRLMLQLSHVQIDDVTVDPRNCQVQGMVFEKTAGYYVFWLIVLTMISASVLVYFFGNTQTKSNSAVSKLMWCFSLSRNSSTLTRVYTEEVGIINGLRSVSCCMAVVAHWVYFSIPIVVNKIDMEQEFFSSLLSNLYLHLDLSVDTFFVLSGLLYFRGLMTSKANEPFKTLLKRYIRLLLPLYVLNITFVTYVLSHIGSGPAWPKMVRKLVDPCAKSWWQNLLMITNQFDDGSICIPTSWFLHCDIQLAILGTIIFIAFRDNKATGFIFGLLIYLLSLVVTGFKIYSQDLPGLMWYDFGESQEFEINKLYQLYVHIFTRTGSYLLGATMGYIISVYKPQNYRGTISKRMSIAGLMAALGVMAWCLTIGTGLLRRGGLTRAVVGATDRSLWSLAICLIIAVCEYGTLPLVSDFLCWNAFVPVSKLCYSNYLWHTMLIYRGLFSSRASVSFDFIRWVTEGVGSFGVSLAMTYVIYLFIEMPANNLINLMFDFHKNSNVKEDEAKSGKLSEKSEKVL